MKTHATLLISTVLFA